MPVCPGYEASTPPEVLVRGNGTAGESGWQVPVIPNKFPALTPEGTVKRHTEAGFFHKMDGFGYHEIIVETPIHNRSLSVMRAEEIEAIMRAYRDRYIAVKKDERIKFILIFKPDTRSPCSVILHFPVVPAGSI